MSPEGKNIMKDTFETYETFIEKRKFLPIVKRDESPALSREEFNAKLYKVRKDDEIDQARGMAIQIRAEEDFEDYLKRKLAERLEHRISHNTSKKRDDSPIRRKYRSPGKNQKENNIGKEVKKTSSSKKRPPIDKRLVFRNNRRIEQSEVEDFSPHDYRSSKSNEKAAREAKIILQELNKAMNEMKVE